MLDGGTVHDQIEHVRFLAEIEEIDLAKLDRGVAERELPGHEVDGQHARTRACRRIGERAGAGSKIEDPGPGTGVPAGTGGYEAPFDVAVAGQVEAETPLRRNVLVAEAMRGSPRPGILRVPASILAQIARVSGAPAAHLARRPAERDP